MTAERCFRTRLKPPLRLPIWIRSGPRGAGRILWRNPSTWRPVLSSGTAVAGARWGTLAALAGVVIEDQGGEDPAAQFEAMIAAQGLARVLPPPLE